jgi:pimeloyl-ACP methyl ester carboxylesterase
MVTISPTDHQVPHVSTVPANTGAHVNLFVREYDGTRPGHVPEPVLMLHGRSAPALTSFDLDHGQYSWAQDLADAGYDVFVMDLQGNGRSPRPEMDNPCNANPAHQSYLIPSTLAGPCAASYPHQLGNTQSECDELHTVVEFVKDLRSVSQVRFIGWSAASFAMGPYTLQHSGNVHSLMLLAPIFPPKGRAGLAGTDFGAPAPLPVSTPATQFGFPMNLGRQLDLIAAWDPELKCAGQRENGMEDVVWNSILDNDAIGKSWGPSGVQRIRNSYWWGWNDTTVPLGGILGTLVPVFLTYGEFDTQAMHPSSNVLIDFSVPKLYNAIPGADKLMVKVTCAGHSMPWEQRAKTLHHMSREWLKHTAVDGLKNGSYVLGTDDEYSPA